MDTELCVPVNKCFRVFTVREVHTKSDGTKDTVAFELAKDLWVDGVSYRSLDEIIAVHMDPIMENLRLLQEHKKFGIRDGRAVNRMLVREAIFGFTKIQPGTIHYAFAMSETLVGHGVLIGPWRNNTKGRNCRGDPEWILLVGSALRYLIDLDRLV